MQPHKCDPKEWAKQTVAIVANGPTGSGVDLSALARVRVMTTNFSCKLYPTADVQMCSDRHWLKDNPDFIDWFQGNRIVVTQPQAVVRQDPRMVKMDSIKIWKTNAPFVNPSTLAEGHTSVSTSISYAVMSGATRILLFFVDLRPGPDGKRRSTGEEKDTLNALVRYKMIAQHLTHQAFHVRRRKVEVIDCTPSSILRCYKKMTIEQGLKLCSGS
jgi:hypothetical protein